MDCGNLKTLELLEAQIPRLRRYARYLVRNVDYADDLVQECLLRAIDNIEKWQPGTSMRAWLLVILRNVYVNDARKKAREVKVFAGWEKCPDVSVPADQESRLALLELRDNFLKLKEEHREVLLLVAVEGLEYEEAAVALDVPIGTVRSRLSRAREALRKGIDGHEVAERTVEARKHRG